MSDCPFCQAHVEPDAVRCWSCLAKIEPEPDISRQTPTASGGSLDGVVGSRKKGPT